MNGYELCKRAFLRLGFDNQSDISLHNRKSRRHLEVVNQIAEDLKIKPLNELSEELVWTKEETEAVCSGVAMLLSLTEGEIAKNQFYTDIYNAKRSAVLSRTLKIEDTLPTAESGDI